MRKAIVCMGIGGPYERQLNATKPFREAYAKKHGWDLVDITEMDERSRKLKDCSTALRCHLQKLLIPDTLRDEYDLLLFLEADVIVHPEAPCISTYERFIPEGGFAAVTCTLPQERMKIFGWKHGHYDSITHPIVGEWATPPEIRNPNFYMNGGIELYRPREVADRWLKLFDENHGTSDENLLNLFDAQDNRILWIPREWNAVWMYEKMRFGYNFRGRGILARIFNKVYNKHLFKLIPCLEMMAFRRHFHYANFHHIAQEGAKIDKLVQAVQFSLKQ